MDTSFFKIKLKYGSLWYLIQFFKNIGTKQQKSNNKNSLKKTTL